MARSFTEPPVPIAIAAGSTQGDPILCVGGGRYFSAAGAACGTDAGSEPRVHAAAAAGECAHGPEAVAASTDLRVSTFFHMSFTVDTKMSEQAAAYWTKLFEESVAQYVVGNCEEGLLVRTYHDTTLFLQLAFRFS